MEIYSLALCSLLLSLKKIIIDNSKLNEVIMSFNAFNRGASGSNIGSTSSGNVIPKGYRHGQLGQFTPQQKNLFSSLFSHVMPGSYLERLASGSEEGFAPIEEGAQRDFQGAMGGLASRFSGIGSGARKSSGFQNEASQSAQDFASKLAEQRTGYQRQALRDLMEMSSSLLNQRPYEQFLTPKSPSFLSQLGSGILGGAGQLGTMFGAKQLGLFGRGGF